MANKHILLIPSWYPSIDRPLSGIFFKEQALALREAGMAVGVIATHSYSLRRGFQGIALELGQGISFIEENDENLRTISLSHFHFPVFQRLNYWRKIAAYKKLYKIYENKYSRPDILHAHSVIWGGAAASKISQETGIPYIITEHSSAFARDMIEEWMEPEIEKSFSKASATISVSESLKSNISSYLKEKKSHVIGNVLSILDDAKSFKRKSSRSVYKFISIASLEKIKGFDILIKAFAEVVKQINQVELTIVGAGREAKKLHTLVSDLGLSDKVTFTGALDRKAVAEILQFHDCFVLPSRFETFGIVFIEALASGIPVIATKCGGPEDFVTENVGYLIPPESEQDCSQAMMDAIARREYWSLQSDSLRDYVLKRYGKRIVTQKISKIYDQVCI